MSDEIVFNTGVVSYGQNKPTHQFKCSGFGLLELLENKGEIVGLEIGCDVGDTAFFLLENNPNLVLHSIDPYIDYVDWNGNSLKSRDEMYYSVLNRMEKFGERFILHRTTSDEKFADFCDKTFDFVFIDGLHTYEQLSKDCLNYYSKVKDNGIFSGHDFQTISGVNKAATEFAEKCKKGILLTECDVWYWYK
jgi:hypothetical protein